MIALLGPGQQLGHANGNASVLENIDKRMHEGQGVNLKTSSKRNSHVALALEFKDAHLPLDGP